MVDVTVTTSTSYPQSACITQGSDVRRWSQMFRPRKDKSLTSDKLREEKSRYTPLHRNSAEYIQRQSKTEDFLNASLKAVSIHLALINAASIYCGGDSYFVNLIRAAISTLFNLPCSHTPLRFSVGIRAAGAFRGCGRAASRTQWQHRCSFPLAACSSLTKGLTAFTLNMHHQRNWPITKTRN